MARDKRILSVWLLSTFGGHLLLLLCAPAWLAFTWAMIHLFILPILIFGIDSRRALALISKFIPHTHVVRTMDHDGEIRHVLAYGEWGQVMHAHQHWLNEIGAMQLHPNGYVQGPVYIYFWEPAHTEDQTVMHLSYDCADWTLLKHMHWTQRADYRQQLEKQTKLKHESHI